MTGLDIEVLARFYGLTDLARDELVSLAVEARRRGWWYDYRGGDALAVLDPGHLRGGAGEFLGDVVDAAARLQPQLSQPTAQLEPPSGRAGNQLAWTHPWATPVRTKSST